MNKIAVTTILSILFVSVLTSTARAANLQGTWSGGGSASFGAHEERIRCRAKYRKLSASRYSLWARCSNGTTRVTQTAKLRKIGINEYRGTFYNSEYGVSGSIYVEISGSRQSVTLSSSNGSADLYLRKR